MTQYARGCRTHPCGGLYGLAPVTAGAFFAKCYIGCGEPPACDRPFGAGAPVIDTFGRAFFLSPVAERQIII